MDGHHELTGMAITALAALACGIGMTRLRQPAIVGYILAGILLGPSGLALVTERDNIALLAELGVLLLLFVVGMELSIRAFKEVWRVATLATAAQIAGSVVIMLVLSRGFGWGSGLAILLGFMVAVSSTAMAIKMLEDLEETDTPVGRLIIGVLIAQDLAVVPMMLVIDAMAGDRVGVLGLGRIVLSLGLLGALFWYLSGREAVALPLARLVAGHVDLAPLAGLTLCFAAAALSGLIGLTPAYGAFLAGIVIGNSNQREEMARSVRPIQSILLMVFFLSIGLLLDLRFVWENLGMVLLLLLVVTLGKSALNIGILRALGQAWPRAFLSGVILAQVGEFSFLLAAVGLASGLISMDSHPLVIAVTVLSLATSPFWMESARRLNRIALLSITSGREILRLLYGAETDLVLEAYGRVSRVLLRGAARIGRAPRGPAPPAGAEAPSPARAPLRIRGLPETLMSAHRRLGGGRRRD
jgi:CPA2 family monovalent cation:H+ antiporter-2